MPDDREAPLGEPAPPASAEPGPDRARSRHLLVGVCGCVFIAMIGLGIKWSAERRADADCRRRLELLWSAAQQYAAANGGKFPYGPRSTEELVFRYLHHARYWDCPRTDSRYSWTSRPRKLGDDPRWLLAWETRPHGWPLGRHRALFADGRIETMSASELKACLARERREPAPPARAVQPKPDLRGDMESPPPGWRLPPKPGEPEKPAGPEPAPVPAPADPQPSPAK